MSASATAPTPAPAPAPARRQPLGWHPAWLSQHRRPAAFAAVAVVVGLAVGLSLGLDGGAAAAAPDTGAARLVPAGALAYLNVSLDTSRPGVAQALRIASRLPGFSGLRAAVERPLAALGGGTSFARASRAWLGDEAALAVIAGTGGASRAGSLVLLACRRPTAARRFIAGLQAVGTTSYRGVQVRRLPSSAYVALLGRYIVLGQVASVDQAIDVQHGAASLAGASDYRRALAGQPPGRVLDLYAPSAGIAALLDGRGGLLGAVRELLAGPGLDSLSASLSAAPGGLRLRVHRVLAPGSVRTAGSALGPSLLRRVPAGTIFAADLSDLVAAAPRLLAATGQLGVGAAIEPLLSRLGGALRAEKFALGPLLSLFSGQTVVAVTGVVSGSPSLLVLTQTTHPGQARIELADLEPALASLFGAAASGPGVTPIFSGRQIGGITIHQLPLGPGLHVDYAVWRHLVGVSTSVSALASLRESGSSLGASPGFRTAFGSSGVRSGSLVFADLKPLIGLGEQTGLLHGPGLARLAPDLEGIRVIGLRSRSGQTDSTSELYFHIP